MTTTADHDGADVEADILSFEWGDIQMLSKILSDKVNPLTGVRNLEMVPYENFVQPVQLNFEPPLIEHAVGDRHGFRHHWELLTYAFNLPDPAAFPRLPALADDDRRVLKRYARMCRQLAGYSALDRPVARGVRRDFGCIPPVAQRRGLSVIRSRQRPTNEGRQVIACD
jgi:hypothetical protein